MLEYTYGTDQISYTNTITKATAESYTFSARHCLQAKHSSWYQKKLRR